MNRREFLRSLAGNVGEQENEVNQPATDIKQKLQDALNTEMSREDFLSKTGQIAAGIYLAQGLPSAENQPQLINTITGIQTSPQIEKFMDAQMRQGGFNPQFAPRPDRISFIKPANLKVLKPNTGNEKGLTFTNKAPKKYSRRSLFTTPSKEPITIEETPIQEKATDILQDRQSRKYYFPLVQEQEQEPDQIEKYKEQLKGVMEKSPVFESADLNTFKIVNASGLRDPHEIFEAEGLDWDDLGDEEKSVLKNFLKYLQSVNDEQKRVIEIMESAGINVPKVDLQDLVIAFTEEDICRTSQSIEPDYKTISKTVLTIGPAVIDKNHCALAEAKHVIAPMHIVMNEVALEYHRDHTFPFNGRSASAEHLRETASTITEFIQEVIHASTHQEIDDLQQYVSNRLSWAREGYLSVVGGSVVPIIFENENGTTQALAAMANTSSGGHQILAENRGLNAWLEMVYAAVAINYEDLDTRKKDALAKLRVLSAISQGYNAIITSQDENTRQTLITQNIALLNSCKEYLKGVSQELFNNETSYTYFFDAMDKYFEGEKPATDRNGDKIERKDPWNIKHGDPPNPDEFGLDPPLVKTLATALEERQEALEQGSTLVHIIGFDAKAFTADIDANEGDTDKYLLQSRPVEFVGIHGQTDGVDNITVYVVDEDGRTVAIETAVSRGYFEEDANGRTQVLLDIPHYLEYDTPWGETKQIDTTNQIIRVVARMKDKEGKEVLYQSLVFPNEPTNWPDENNRNAEEGKKDEDIVEVCKRIAEEYNERQKSPH